MTETVGFLNVSMGPKQFLYLWRIQDTWQNQRTSPNHLLEILVLEASKKNPEAIHCASFGNCASPKGLEDPSTMCFGNLQYGINIFQKTWHESVLRWEHWNFENLRLWSSESFNLWNFVALELWNFKSRKERNQESIKPRTQENQATKKPINVTTFWFSSKGISIPLNIPTPTPCTRAPLGGHQATWGTISKTFWGCVLDWDEWPFNGHWWLLNYQYSHQWQKSQLSCHPCHWYTLDVQALFLYLLWSHWTSFEIRRRLDETMVVLWRPSYPWRYLIVDSLTDYIDELTSLIVLQAIISVNVEGESFTIG